MTRSRQCIDARDTFAARASGPLKFPAFAPNMMFLHDLCAGICQAWTERSPLPPDPDKTPSALQLELREAVERHVHDVTEVAVTPISTGLYVLVDAAFNDCPFTFGFTIGHRWLKTIEKSAENGHRK